MSKKEGFFLGLAIFSVLAVGTYAVLNKGISLAVFSIIDIEQPSEINLLVLSIALVILLLASIVLPATATRILLRRCS